MPTRFLTWFSARFSHWEPLTLLHVRSKVRINLMFSEEWEPIMRSSFIFYIDIFLGEPNMFSHRIYIQFWESLRQLVLLPFICYISYALLLATSYSVFIFQFYDLASIVSIPRKILHKLAVSFFGTVQLWWKAFSKQKTSAQNNEILSKHVKIWWIN
jgi:hypothetical protein